MLFRNCPFKSFCYPFIEAHAVMGCPHGKALMNIRIQTHIECAGKRLLRRFALLGAILKIHLNGFRQRGLEFINGTPLKGNDIGKVQYIAMKNVGIRVVFKTALIPLVCKYAHSITPAFSRKRRTDLIAPLSVSGCGCGRWKVAISVPIINLTREPLPSFMMPPQALNKLSISLQAIAGLTGSVKIAIRVLRWLLFIEEWYYFLVNSQVANANHSCGPRAPT